MTTIALPMAARATDAAACRGYLQRMTRLGVLAGGAGTAGLLLAAPIAIHLLYGGAFQPAVLAFSVLALGLVPNFWGNLTAQLLYTTGHTRVLFGIHLVQLGIMLVCLGPAINAGGLLGAAVVRAATNAGAALAADAMARRIVGQMERAASSASVAIEGS